MLYHLEVQGRICTNFRHDFDVRLHTENSDSSGKICPCILASRQRDGKPGLVGGIW